jgi:hypothetical protein
MKSNLDVHLSEPGHLHFVQVHFTTDKFRPGSPKIFFSRRVSILVLDSFQGIKSSITAIAVIELFIPEKSEGHVQKAGLDFRFFTQQNQMESVRFREKRKKMFGGEKWRM